MARPVAKDYGTKRRLILDRAAQACGIPKANVYHCYSGKDEILFDILNACLSGLRDSIFAFQDNLSGQAPREKFTATVMKILLHYQGMDNEHRLQTTVLNHLPEDQQKVLLGYQRDIVRLVSGLIADMEPCVFADDKAKLRATTMSVFGMLNRFYMWTSTADEQDRRNYAVHVSRLCENGFAGL